MAAKKGNGHDPATTAIVEALGRIEKQIEATNARLDGTNARLDALRDEFHAFREETREEFGAVRADVASLKTEVASLRVETRAESALGEERVARLEATVFRPTGT